MAQPLRIEHPNEVQFITCRTLGSRLYFANSVKLQARILGYLAKYQAKYGVELYAFVFMGNHYHMIARFPRSNRADFMRALNSRAAALVGSTLEDVDTSKIWGRRYSAEVLPTNADVENWAFYTWLNPVSTGLARWIAGYRSYNSFVPSIYDHNKEYEVVDWTRFNNHKRSNPNVSITKYIKKYPLKFSRLPGYEGTPAPQYIRGFLEKLELRRKRLVSQRTKRGKGFPKKGQLLATIPKSKPKTTKKGSRSERRPRVLTMSAEVRRLWLERYHSIVNAYRIASARYRAGILDTIFPPLTYRPLLLTRH